MKYLRPPKGLETLIPLSSFVLQTNETHKEYASLFKSRVLLYTKFLKQKPSLSMFIPIDEDGNVLEKPDVRCIKENFCQCGEEDALDCKKWKIEYQEALDKTLFEGFAIRDVKLVGYNRVRKNILCREKDTCYWDFNKNVLWDMNNGTFRDEFKTLEDLIYLNLKLRQ